MSEQHDNPDAGREITPEDARFFLSLLTRLLEAQACTARGIAVLNAAREEMELWRSKAPKR